MLKSPHKNVWILNGNNIQIGGDLGRRVYMSRIDANLKQPWLRGNFKHNQKVWIMEQRSNILQAIYTIVRGWVRAGATPANEQIPIMGSFEEWRNIIGGIMQFINCNSVLSNSSEVIENIDIDSPAWDLFINTLFERIADWDKKDRTMRGSVFSKVKSTNEVLFTTHDVLDILEYEKDPNRVGDKIPLIDTLPDSISDGYANAKNANRVIGIRLRSQLGRIFSNGLKLEKTDIMTDNKTQWRIVKVLVSN
jgi:hypothetical protein